LRRDELLFPDDWRFEREEPTVDRLLCALTDDVAGGLDTVPVVEDLALPCFNVIGLDVAGLTGSIRFLPDFVLLPLWVTIS